MKTNKRTKRYKLQQKIAAMEKAAAMKFGGDVKTGKRWLWERVPAYVEAVEELEASANV